MKPIHYILIILAIGIALLPLANIIIKFCTEKLLLQFSKQAYYKIVLSIMGIVCIYIIFSSYKANENKYKKEEAEEAKKTRIIQEAFAVSKIFVEKKLKSPSTAKFASMSDEESKYKINDDESIIIRSYVDAQNSFGATVRTHFQCTVDKRGNVNNLTTW